MIRSATCFNVACTRARDHLMVSGVELGSEFLSGLLWGDLATCKEARLKIVARSHSS